MLIQERLSHRQLDLEHLSFLRAISVDHLELNPCPWTDVSGWNAEQRAEHHITNGAGPPLAVSGYRFDQFREYLSGAKSLCASSGIDLQTIAMGGPNRSVTLGLPERDAEIEVWCELLRAMGEVGVTNVFYNFKPTGNHRTTDAVGRGGAQYSTFKYSDWLTEYDGSKDSPISEEAMWANLAYFLQGVVPAAEAAGVRLALHPEDPPVLEPLGQAAHITSTLDQYERVFALAESHANAMTFCQGCVTEMGEEGRGGSIADAIHRMVAQDKVCFVHFRNLSSENSPHDFREVFVDEGEVNMIETMQVWRDAGFYGAFCHDHTPHFATDSDGSKGVAFAVGYIRACIQVAYAENTRRAADKPVSYHRL